jgi:hypothetical protein
MNSEQLQAEIVAQEDAIAGVQARLKSGEFSRARRGKTGKWAPHAGPIAVYRAPRSKEVGEIESCAPASRARSPRKFFDSWGHIYE